MWALIFLGFLFISLVIVRFRYSWRTKKIGEIWLDGFIVNLLASFVILSLAYIFRMEIYKIFQQPRVSFQASCLRTDNTRKPIYSCDLQIQNENEASLTEYSIAIDSSKDFKNFNFVDCNPTDVSGEDLKIISQTKAVGEVTCAYRIDLDSFGKIKFKLKIMGDENVPNPDLLQ